MKRLLIGLMVFFLITTCLAGWFWNSTANKYNALAVSYASLQSENTNLKTQLSQSELNLAKLQADYDVLCSNYQSVNGELEQIKVVYPPRYFNSYNELVGWMNALPTENKDWNGLSKRALLRQSLALKDGFIWNVGLRYDFTLNSVVFVETVIAGNVAYNVENDGSLTPIFYYYLP